MLPGRWPHATRELAEGHKELATRETPSSCWLEAQNLGGEGLLDIAPGQPLRLRLIYSRQPETQIEIFYCMGILEPLPRTPHVFEEQAKWPLDNKPWEPGLAWVPSYSSAREHKEFATEKFEV